LAKSYFTTRSFKTHQQQGAPGLATKVRSGFAVWFKIKLSSSYKVNAISIG